MSLDWHTEELPDNIKFIKLDAFRFFCNQVIIYDGVSADKKIILKIFSCYFCYWYQ